MAFEGIEQGFKEWTLALAMTRPQLLPTRMPELPDDMRAGRMYPSRRLRESRLIVGVEAADDRLMRNGLGINGNHLRHNQSGTTMSPRD